MIGTGERLQLERWRRMAFFLLNSLSKRNIGNFHVGGGFSIGCEDFAGIEINVGVT
jgi:hypothetical protein